MKNTITIIFMLIITTTMTFIINKTYSMSKGYESLYIEYSKTKTLNNNVKYELENLVNKFMGTFININNKKIVKKEKRNYKEKLKDIKYKIKSNIIYILTLLFISIILYFILCKKIILSFLYIQSIVFLIYGLISPIFLMYVTQEFASNFVILQFESNSILSSIEKLFNQNNYFVGGIILIFSVVFPIIKTIISFIALHINNVYLLNKFSNISSSLAKLSMTDVFVLSIFLVYLSPMSDGIIKTELEIGFLFFFVYVIISLFIAVLNKQKI